MKIACVYKKNYHKGNALFDLIQKQVSIYPIEDADVIVCLGGDGFMLHTIHKYFNLNKPIYGINCGNIGFLLNNYTDKPILESINNSSTHYLSPLIAKAYTIDGSHFQQIAFNEISLIRNVGHSSQIKISIDDQVRLPKLVGDGVLVSTPTGSTAYNKSCGGSVIPLNSKSVVLTPINPYQPMYWRGTVLNNTHIFRFDITDHNTRFVNLYCDFIQHKTPIKYVTVQQCFDTTITLLFDQDNNLEDRIIKSQFY